MAKISAHGTILARVSKQWPSKAHVTDITQCIHIKVLMSDGVVLEKYTFLRTDGSKNYQGWKKVGKVKPEFSTADAWCELQRKNGFERETL